MVFGRQAQVLLVAMVFSTATVAGEPARAGGIDDAAAFIRDLSGRAVATLKERESPPAERRARFRLLLEEGLALDLIGRMVAGRFWRRASESQREDYLQIFRQYVLTAYSRRFDSYAYSGDSIDIGAATEAGGGDVMVATTINRPGATSLNAAWRVRLIDGAHKVIDVVVEGVSMAVTQRQEFASVITSRGFDGLIHALRDRVAALASDGGGG